MQSSERREATKQEAKIIATILQELPSEINGGMIAALLVNILYRYEMYEEWHKIVEAVDETLDSIDDAIKTDISEVLMN